MEAGQHAELRAGQLGGGTEMPMDGVDDMHGAWACHRPREPSRSGAEKVLGATTPVGAIPHDDEMRVRGRNATEDASAFL